MSLEVQTNPLDLGFDPARLARISTHFRKYVDDGRLPNWSVAVSRHGKLAFTDAYGHAHVADGKPMELDTIVRIF